MPVSALALAALDGPRPLAPRRPFVQRSCSSSMRPFRPSSVANSSPDFGPILPEPPSRVPNRVAPPRDATQKARENAETLSQDGAKKGRAQEEVWAIEKRGACTICGKFRCWHGLRGECDRPNRCRRWGRCWGSASLGTREEADRVVAESGAQSGARVVGNFAPRWADRPRSWTNLDIVLALSWQFVCTLVGVVLLIGT